MYRTGPDRPLPGAPAPTCPRCSRCSWAPPGIRSCTGRQVVEDPVHLPFQAREAHIDRFEASVASIEPREHSAKSRVDAIDPLLNGVEFRLDPFQPAVDDVEPSVDGVEPSVDGVEPSVHAIEPSVHAVEPSVHAVEPLAQLRRQALNGERGVVTVFGRHLIHRHTERVDLALYTLDSNVEVVCCRHRSAFPAVYHRPGSLRRVSAAQAHAGANGISTVRAGSKHERNRRISPPMRGKGGGSAPPNPGPLNL